MRRERQRQLPTGISRRTLLRGAGMVAGTAAMSGILGACTNDDDPADGASPAPTGGGSGLAGGTVRFWSVVEGPADEAFQRKKFDEFMQANPDVTVEPQFFPTAQFGEAMQLAFTGGDAPDVFRQVGAQNLHLTGALSRGWVRPIDEFLTDEFTQRWPEWAFDPERSPLCVEGEAYGVPFPDPATAGARLLLYNTDIVEASGFDGPPETWSQMRDMVAKITTDGSGDVFGFAPAAWVPLHFALQALAGPQPLGWNTVPLSLLTGEPAMSEPSLIETVEFLQGMQADELYTPGWEGWAGHQQYIEQMAAGRLGMYIFPLFHVALLREANPDLNLGIAAPPIPDSGQAGSLIASNNVMPHWMMSSEAREPEAAWRVMDFLGSVDFQRAAYEELRQIPLMPAVWEQGDIDDDTNRIREVAAETVRQHPRPETKHSGATQFWNDVVANGPTPRAGERLLEAVSRGSDYPAMAADFDAATQAAIDAQLATSDVTMDAFTFPDWNPLEDYGA